jgi:AcrR family transcriptional regulator
LLDAAAELFTRDGVGSGVEALCRAAGVSKRSMYQLFDSKDQVLAASLERLAPTYRASLLPDDHDQRPPRERVLHVFERLEALTASPDYRGCPFMGMAIELKDPQHPASQVARHFKQALTDFFSREVERGGGRDPETLARQLTMVFDGASARAVVQAEALTGLAVAMAITLLDAAGVRADSQAT